MLSKRKLQYLTELVDALPSHPAHSLADERLVLIGGFVVLSKKVVLSDLKKAANKLERRKK